MQSVIVCHLENDLWNSSGEAKRLPPEKQTFDHVPMLLRWLSALDLPITIAVMVGGQTEDRLLRVSSLKSLPENFELALHYHAEKFVDGTWSYTQPLREDDYRSYYEKFVLHLGKIPRSIVFGKWIIDVAAFPIFEKLGLTHDGSEIPRNAILKPPYERQGILSVPTVSFNGRPVNPLTRFSDFLLFRRIFEHYNSQNILSHLAFHSYDLFSFGKGGPRFRPHKQKILLSLIRQMKNNNIGTIKLGDCRDDGYMALDTMKLPRLAILSQKLGH